MVENKVLTLARQYADAVRDTIPAKDVFLYGSHAKGVATKDSDIDIAIVVNDIPGDYLSVMASLWKLGRSISQEIEPVLLSLEDADSGFFQTVRRTGIPV